MELKYEGKSYFIGQEMWDKMNAHALQRGMTLDEYLFCDICPDCRDEE